MHRTTVSLLITLLAAPLLAVATTEIAEKEWEYEWLDEDHVSIHNSDQSRQYSAIDPDKAVGDIEVPSSLHNGQVVTIGEKAFYNCSKMTSVVIPEGVTNIDDSAFWGCTSLTNVVFPASLKSIGKDAFYCCSGLASANLTGASLTIGDHAFIGCSDLESFDFGGDAITLGTAAFSGCTQMSSLYLRAKVIDIGESAFAYYYYNRSFDACGSLVTASLEASTAATIGRSAFSECTALQSAQLPVTLKDLATNLFYRCSALEAIALSTNVTHISYRAFDTCTALKSIAFAEGLTGIDAQAFYGCTSITNLAFPQSLAAIGSRAFERCDMLIDVAFAEGNTNYVAAKSVTIGERVFYKCSAITNVTLSQAVSSLGERSFSQCTSLAGINLPTKMAEIAASAFEDCSALPAIALPNSLTSIGDNAFFNCTSLENFSIPTNRTVSLGAKAFKYTKYWNDYPDDLVVNNGYILGFKGNPETVTLPENCKSIPVAMFEDMTTLKCVTIPDSVTEIGSRAFNGCSGLTNLAFKSVKTIGNSAFEGCTSLANVTLSNCLTAIPGNAFKDCTALTTIFIPTSVTSIGEYAFYNCASLETVTGGTGVTKAGDYAFAECPVLQPFGFANDVAYGVHVFQGCTWTEHVLFPTVGTLKEEYPATYANITSVVFSSNMSIITNSACAGCRSLAYVKIPDGVTTIGTLAFDGCSSLTSVVMSASVASVATNAFAGCSNVVSAVVTGTHAMKSLFPASYQELCQIGFVDDVTTLCTNLFAGCVSLKSLDIPDSVTSIEARAFDGCTGISSIAWPTNVATIAAGTFANCTALKSFVAPSGVTKISSLAFDGCTSLSSIVMMASVTNVSNNAFRGCNNIVSLTVSGAVPLATMFPDIYTNMTTIGIADDATSLCANLFSNCVSLASVEIPWRVKSIGARAFYGCTQLAGGLVVPEYVTSIGDKAFANCKTLRSVDYLCNYVGSAPTNMYAGTRGDLMSKVLVGYASWPVAVTNSAGVFQDWCDRTIVWWGSIQTQLARVYFSYNTNYGGGTNLYFLAVSGRQILTLPALPEHPFNSKLVCTGWYTAASGGTKIESGVPVTQSVTYYAHYGEEEVDDDDDDDDDDDEKDDDEDEDEDPEDEDDSIAYDFTCANTYNGYLTDDDGVVGTVQISFAKGKTDQKTGKATASATASVQYIGEKRVALKGTLLSDGSATLSATGTNRTMTITFEADDAEQLTGMFDDLEVVAYRNIFSYTCEDDEAHGKAFLESASGNYTAVFEAGGDTAFTAGYVALSISVGTGGKTRVAGTMPDGTHIYGYMQLSILSDETGDIGIVPVALPMYGQKGGFGFLLKFTPDGEGGYAAEISELSVWIADKIGTEVPLNAIGVNRVSGLEEDSHIFHVDLSSLAIENASICDELSPDGTEITVSAKKWSLPRADMVRYSSDAGYYTMRGTGNPAGLRLVYTSRTGLFTGSFRVYVTTDAGRRRTYVATIKGGVINGKGYGTAVIQKVGSAAVDIQ